MKYIPSIAVGVGAFIATFDVTAVSLLLPSISRQFSLDVAGYVWVMDAYSLALTIVLMTAGAIADRYGQRFTIVGGAVVFLVSSLLCAFAPSYGALITGRAVQGAGAAFVVCAGLAWAGRRYSDRTERAHAFAIIGTISGSALAIGPALGGLIASTFGWQAVFLMNIPICILIIVGSVGWMDEYRNQDRQRFDILGTVVVSLLLLISTWFLLRGPVVAGLTFNNMAVVLTIVVLVAALIRVELRALHPTVDLNLFRKPSFVGLSFVPLSLAVSYWSLIVFMPVFIASSLGVGTRYVALTMLFFTLPMFVVPFVVARLAAQTRQSTYYFSGLLIVSIGCLVITLGAYLNAFVFSIAGMVIAGVGAATIQSQVSGALISSAPQHRAGAASAILMVFRQGGFAVASAWLSKVVQSSVDVGPYTIANFTLLLAVCTVAAGIGSAFTFILVRTDERAKLVEQPSAATGS